MIIACDCSLDTAYMDAPSLISVAWRKARKPHECGECGAAIHPGERYEYVSGLWDGEWGKHYTCQPCVAIRDWYCPGGYCYGEVATQIDDCLGFDYRAIPVDDDAI